MATSLENQYIDESYQKVVQVSGSYIADGTGSVITNLNLTASHAVTASYAVSASHEIVKEISSSYADVAGIADAVSGSNVVGAVDTANTASYILAANIDGTVASATSASYSSTASYAENAGDWSGVYEGDAQITGSLTIQPSGSGAFLDIKQIGSSPSYPLFTVGQGLKDGVDYFFDKGMQVNGQLVMIGTGAYPELLFYSNTHTGSLQENKFTFTDRNTGLVATQYTANGFLIGSSSRADFSPLNTDYVTLTSTQNGFTSAADNEWGLKFKSGSTIFGPVLNMLVVDRTTGKMNTELALSSSNSISASAFKGDGTDITGVISASYAATASYALNSVPQVSASYAQNATSASHAINADTASLAVQALQSTLANTASFALTALSSSHASSATLANFAASATSASHAVQADSALTANSATTATSASYAATSSYAGTAAFATDALDATTAQAAISSSHALVADTSISSSYALTASYALVTEHVSASHAVNADTASYVDYTNIANKPTLVSGSGQIDLALAFGTASQALTASYVDAANVSGSITNAEFAEYANNTIVYGKNLSGGVIAKGTPLYFTGSGTSGNTVGVYAADAGNPARMPAGGVAGEDIAIAGEGRVFLDGFLNGVDTSAFNSGDAVYVAVGGGYTNIKPTGSANLIQALGYVEKSDLNGSGVIQGSGRANDVPNITQNYTWVGNANGVAIPTDVSTLSVATASYVEYSNVANKPTLISSSAQIASDISGSFTSVSASIATDIASNTSNIVTLTSKTGSYATTGSNTFVGKQTINTGYAEQNFAAPGTNQEVALFNVNGSVVNSKNYNRVFFGQADYPGFGVDYQDYFALEYYNGFGYNFGSEFSMNGKGARLVAVPSGSGFSKRASVEVKDNYDGTSTYQAFGDLFFLTGRNYIQINDNSGDAIKLGGVSGNVQITGSNGVDIKSPTSIDDTLNVRRIHFDKNPFNSTVTNNLGAIRLNADGKTYTNTLYDQSLITSQSAHAMYIDTGSNTLENYLQTNYAGTTNELKLKNVGSTRTVNIDTDTFSVTGSAKFADVMNLAAQNPLPTGALGDLSVSGSGLYFHNGTSWTLIS